VTPAVQDWLLAAGYENHCFISWPHVEDHEIAECARAVRSAIESELRYSIPQPRVFLDERDFRVGDLWREALRSALCKSVAMVAICAPIYYHPSHPWCGFEWAAMESLGEQRLKPEQYRTIIPIILRERGSLPTVVSKLQFVDFSKTSVQGRHYYRTREFRAKIIEVIGRIEEIAEALVRHNQRANCDEFVLPTASAFADLAIPSQQLPFRESP
jgi:hypothetical protein